MSDCNTRPLIFLIPALAVLLGLGLAGFFVQQGLKEFRGADRTVSMKGLAQRDVEADLALWTIKHSATGNNLAEVQASIKTNGDQIRRFLQDNNLGAQDLAGRRLEVTDLLAQQYRPDNADQSRYIVSEVITVRSNNVDAVDAAYQNSGDLLLQNISLITEQNQSPIEYVFTKLNDIKPDMIAEATKNARESAQQFANDSETQVGKIREAYQGVFQILPRDSDASYQERQSRYKTVRVVSTIKFALD